MALRKKTAARKAKASTVRGKKKKSPHARVTGSERPATTGAVRVADANPQSKVEVTITLRGPKLPAVHQLQGRPLSSRAIRDKFGASSRDAAKVSEVLRKFGLKIDAVSLDTRSMKVSGTVAQMEVAFHPNLGIYESADQGRFRDRQQAYVVPAPLKDIVTAVIGFGERRVAVRRRARRPNMASVVSRLSPLGPADIEQLYCFPSGNSRGRKIAIAELGGGYFAHDLRAYCAKFGRPVPSIKTVSVNMPVRSLSQIKRLAKPQQSDEMDFTGEVMMDVQIVAGLCPKARISVYFATFDQKGWVDLLDRVIKDRPVALSVSWGLAEDSSEWSSVALAEINQRLHQAALLGITICCASGDDGTGDEETDGRAHVDFPSSSPYTLAVGGTMIGERAGKFFEEVWRQSPGRRTSNGGGSTGGGVSSIFPRPGWQKVKVPSLNRGSRAGRVVPDIAALAGPPWYDLVFRGRNTYGGGTSASAPVLAALIARIDALLPPKKQQRYLAPLLYRRISNGKELGRLACRDITIGHNASNPKPGIGYLAGEGFDAVSGWGTPIGTSLLLALQDA